MFTRDVIPRDLCGLPWARPAVGAFYHGQETYVVTTAGRVADARVVIAGWCVLFLGLDSGLSVGSVAFILPSTAGLTVPDLMRLRRAASRPLPLARPAGFSWLAAPSRAEVEAAP